MGDQLIARAQMVEFLKENAGRRIAIFFLGDRLRLLQGFTSDPDLLASAAKRTGGVSLKGYRSELTGDPVSQTDGSPGGSGGRITELEAAEMRTNTVLENERLKEASQSLDERVGTTLDALVQIGHFLTGFSGRKNLIWYSGAFPVAITPAISSVPSGVQRVSQPGSLVRDDSDRSYVERIKDAANALNSAEVAVYPIDARGLQTDASSSASASASSSRAPSGVNPFFGQQASGFATMDLIGGQTGGHAFYNTNQLKGALETAADEGSSYYSLVYAPTNGKYDGSVRRIAIQLEHGHYQLAYRKSYIADDDVSIAHKQAANQDGSSPYQPAASDDSMEESAQFGAPPAHQLIFAARLDAVGEPAPATAEQMAALAPYRERAAAVTHRKLLQPKTPDLMQQYAVIYAAPASQLNIPRSADGVSRSDISIAALAFDEDGETLWGTKTELKDEIPASKIDQIRRDGFQAKQTLLVPVQTAVIRLVVRDEQSGKLGSMEIRLPLPPEQQKGIGAR